MSIEDRLITIQKKGIEIKTDIRGAQIASIKTVNTDGYDLEIMNQGLLDPEHSAYGKTAPNLVMRLNLIRKILLQQLMLKVRKCL